MKPIRSRFDLAVCGASPAFEEPVHVGRPNLGSKRELLRLVGEIYDRRWLTNNGPLVQELESRLANLAEVEHCVLINNGTTALEIAIRALGLAGEVIVPSYTFIATAHALRWQGITPVFADIDPATHNLDPDSVERRITERTTGIIGVHLWGRPAPVAELERVANRHGLELMFDAAHAFGASLGGRKVGGFGRCEVFSFHATKVFNTLEGGAVTSNDGELANAIRLMRNFGFAGYDNVEHLGTNGKMSEMSAAVGLVNLDARAEFVDANRRSFHAFRELLSSFPALRLLEFDESNEPNYQYVVIEVAESFAVDRDRLVEILFAENVLARKYFWPGCHRMKPYLSGLSEELPQTEAVARRVVVLPTGPGLPDEFHRFFGDLLGVVEREGGSL